MAEPTPERMREMARRRVVYEEDGFDAEGNRMVSEFDRAAEDPRAKPLVDELRTCPPLERTLELIAELERMRLI